MSDQLQRCQACGVDAVVLTADLQAAWERTDDLTAQVAALTSRAEAAERERDEAIAHDRQSYPTASAYETACAALQQWRVRAEAAEAGLTEIMELFKKRPEGLYTAAVIASRALNSAHLAARRPSPGTEGP